MPNDTDKSATMKQYFACMDSADFVTSAAMFADDAVYIRPPYVRGQAAFASSGTERIEGLPAIGEFWEHRGKRNTHHVIKIEGISGSEWFAEGEVSVDAVRPGCSLPTSPSTAGPDPALRALR